MFGFMEHFPGRGDALFLKFFETDIICKRLNDSVLILPLWADATIIRFKTGITRV